VNDLRDTCQPDGAADRAASAARTLAAIAHNAARQYVKRDAVTPQADGANDDPVLLGVFGAGPVAFVAPVVPVDKAERERQARLRRWHELPHPNRKGR
jgi:hypothetical protein